MLFPHMPIMMMRYASGGIAVMAFSRLSEKTPVRPAGSGKQKPQKYAQSEHNGRTQQHDAQRRLPSLQQTRQLTPPHGVRAQRELRGGLSVLRKNVRLVRRVGRKDKAKRQHQQDQCRDGKGKHMQKLFHHPFPPDVDDPWFIHRRIMSARILNIDRQMASSRIVA